MVRRPPTPPLFPYTTLFRSEREPAHAVENRLDRVLRRTLDVGVLDAQNKGPLLMTRERPREKRGTRAAKVQVPGRARRKARANRAHGSQRRSSVVGIAGFGG